MVSPGNCSQIMTSISPTFKKEVGKCVFIHPNQFIISLFSSLITDTIPPLLKSTQIFYSCSYTLASTHDLSQLHNTSHVHIHPPDHACPSHLDVFLGEKPWPVGQDFVELSELLQLLRGFVQAVQPLGVTPDLEEVVDM